GSSTVQSSNGDSSNKSGMSSDSDQHSRASHVAAIAGGVASAVVLILLLAVFLWCRRRRARRLASPMKPTSRGLCYLCTSSEPDADILSAFRDDWRFC